VIASMQAGKDKITFESPWCGDGGYLASIGEKVLKLVKPDPWDKKILKSVYGKFLQDLRRCLAFSGRYGIWELTFDMIGPNGSTDAWELAFTDLYSGRRTDASETAGALEETAEGRCFVNEIRLLLAPGIAPDGKRVHLCIRVSHEEPMQW
jgi:hypothetical protein